ncbi:hypothetical protein [Vitreimonas flagellata]|uniref:hypothetical protein n=1 Tax=Vitreimonas flagellata TaxID=2560861 RepID=UPI001074F2C8|nr:hypothetical protein [Vitreimonas flagellata]
MTPVAAITAAYLDRWDEAFAVMGAAANDGDDYARAQLDVLSGDLDTLLQPPKMERIHDSSSVFVCRGFAPPAICDWLIQRAQPRLRPALVHNAKLGRLEEDSSRTNTTSVIEVDMINAVMQERAARLTRVPKVQHEPPTISPMKSAKSSTIITTTSTRISRVR